MCVWAPGSHLPSAHRCFFLTVPSVYTTWLHSFSSSVIFHECVIIRRCRSLCCTSSSSQDVLSIHMSATHSLSPAEPLPLLQGHGLWSLS